MQNIDIKVSGDTSQFTSSMDEAIQYQKKFDSVLSGAKGPNELRVAMKNAAKEAATLTYEFSKMSDEAKQTDIGKALAEQLDAAKQKYAELVDMNGDLRREITNMASDTANWDAMQEGIGLVSDGLQTAANVMGAFGVSTQDTARMIAAANGIQSAFNTVIKIGNTLQEESKLGVGLHKAAIAAHNVTMKAATALTSAFTIMLKGKKAAMVADTAATKGASLATKAFSVALDAIGIGLILAGIAALIAYWDDLCSAFKTAANWLGDLTGLWHLETDAEEEARKTGYETADAIIKVREETEEQKNELADCVNEWKNAKDEYSRTQALEHAKKCLSDIGVACEDTQQAEYYLEKQVPKLNQLIELQGKIAEAAAVRQIIFAAAVKNAIKEFEDSEEEITEAELDKIFANAQKRVANLDKRLGVMKKEAQKMKNEIGADVEKNSPHKSSSSSKSKSSGSSKKTNSGSKKGGSTTTKTEKTEAQKIRDELDAAQKEYQDGIERIKKLQTEYDDEGNKLFTDDEILKEKIDNAKKYFDELDKYYDKETRVIEKNKKGQEVEKIINPLSETERNSYVTLKYNIQYYTDEAEANRTKEEIRKKALDDAQSIVNEFEGDLVTAQNGTYVSPILARNKDDINELEDQKAEIQDKIEKNTDLINKVEEDYAKVGENWSKNNAVTTGLLNANAGKQFSDWSLEEQEAFNDATYAMGVYEERQKELLTLKNLLIATNKEEAESYNAIIKKQDEISNKTATKEAYKNAYTGIKSTTSAISSLYDTYKNLGDAFKDKDAFEQIITVFDTLFKTIDNVINIIEGVNSVLKLFKLLSAAGAAEEVTESGATVAAKTAEAAANKVATATATTAAYASIPFVGPAAAAAAMSSYKALWALAAFANGGIVKSGSLIGDKNLVRVNGNEMILNTRQQSRLFGLLDGTTGLNNNRGLSTTTVIRGDDIYVTQNNRTNKYKHLL